MSQADLRTDPRPANSATPYQDELAAENVSLRLLLAQAEIDAQSLLATAGIDAREREAADKLQKLILEELHHRIKNTLATVGAIVSQSLRDLPEATALFRGCGVVICHRSSLFDHWSPIYSSFSSTIGIGRNER